jgi:DNA-binding PadR family transcriptional regulator
MQLKEQLVLFLINCEPGLKGVNTLIRILDRANFPSEIGKSLQTLVDLKYIKITRYYDNTNRVPTLYASTEKGKDYLKLELNETKLIEYIANMDDPEFLLNLVKAYLKKRTK